MSSVHDAEQELLRSRAELEATLAELQRRFDVPQQARLAGHRLRSSYQARPALWIGAAAGVALAAAAAIVWRARR